MQINSDLFPQIEEEESGAYAPEESSDISSEITEDIPEEESYVSEEASEELNSPFPAEMSEDDISESSSETSEIETESVVVDNVVQYVESDADYSQMESWLETIAGNTLQIHNDNLMIFNRLEVCACLLILILLIHLIKLFTGILSVFFKS